MKRKIGIFALVLAVLLCFMTVSAFAAEENGSSQMPFVDSDEIMPEQPDIQTEADLMEDFEEVFGDLGGGMLFFSMSVLLSTFLFLPALITMIVFIVLNSNTKKRIREYERFFGPIPQNVPTYYNANMNNMPYGAQQVNPTGSPMGTAPAGNPYIPQNDINNQQGGQF